MQSEQLSVGMKAWIVRRYGFDEIADYVDGPFLVVAFDQEMVYAVRGHDYPNNMATSGDSEFFKVEELFENREAAEGSLEKASTK